MIDLGDRVEEDKRIVIESFRSEIIFPSEVVLILIGALVRGDAGNSDEQLLAKMIKILDK